MVIPSEISNNHCGVVYTALTASLVSISSFKAVNYLSYSLCKVPSLLRLLWAFSTCIWRVMGCSAVSKSVMELYIRHRLRMVCLCKTCPDSKRHGIRHKDMLQHMATHCGHVFLSFDVLSVLGRNTTCLYENSWGHVSTPPHFVACRDRVGVNLATCQNMPQHIVSSTHSVYRTIIPIDSTIHNWYQYQSNCKFFMVLLHWLQYHSQESC